MTLYEVNPFWDARWPEFLKTHPDASVFHTPAWLAALKRTYGYEPVVLTTSEPGTPIANGIPFCRVKSWLTGTRFVSLPFSDHCQPLVRSKEELHSILTGLRAKTNGQYKYVELRPLHDAIMAEDSTQFIASAVFHHSILDLRPAPDQLFLQMHHSCVQRKIRRAEKEGLICHEGRSEDLLNDFYALLLLTRRRHGLPPQPLGWFRNLARCLGRYFTIRIAYKARRPVASIITLRHKNREIYKYGCSDARFHALGGMQFLFWRAICAAKTAQCEEMDLGRSDVSNSGLNLFKLHLGAQPSELRYYRFPAVKSEGAADYQKRLMSKLCMHLPQRCLVAAGNLLYRHMG